MTPLFEFYHGCVRYVIAFFCEVSEKSFKHRRKEQCETLFNHSSITIISSITMILFQPTMKGVFSDGCMIRITIVADEQAKNDSRHPFLFAEIEYIVLRHMISYRNIYA